MKKPVAFILAILAVIASVSAQPKGSKPITTATALRQIFAVANHSFRGIIGEPDMVTPGSYKVTVVVPGTTDAYIDGADTAHSYYVATILRNVPEQQALAALLQWKKKIAATFPKLTARKSKLGNSYLFTRMRDSEVPEPGLSLSAGMDDESKLWTVRLFIHGDL